MLIYRVGFVTNQDPAIALMVVGLLRTRRDLYSSHRQENVFFSFIFPSYALSMICKKKPEGLQIDPYKNNKFVNC